MHNKMKDLRLNQIGRHLFVAHASACWRQLQLALPGPWAEAHSSTLKTVLKK